MAIENKRAGEVVGLNSRVAAARNASGGDGGTLSGNHVAAVARSFVVIARLTSNVAVQR